MLEILIFYAKYVYCPDSEETVEHFLLHCPLYDNIKTSLRQHQNQTTASSTSNTQQAMWIHHTISAAHNRNEQPPTSSSTTYQQ